MPDPTGFLTTERKLPARRPVPVRIQDWREVYTDADEPLIRSQAGRCMDCGIPFCHQACPLNNVIPDWNDLVRTGDWEGALETLHATNNFPEFTGRLCPAPCEAACVLGIPNPGTAAAPVTIKQVEVSIIDRGYEADLVQPQPARVRTGRAVAVVGSGPAGLAAAQQLARNGHAVTVFERDQRVGGLLRYGIPDFKLEKRHIDRRLEQLVGEGVTFRTGVNVGEDVPLAAVREEYDAVLLACGALAGRDMPELPGRGLAGVHLAMAHLVEANRRVSGETVEPNPIDAAGKHVIIIGGGDTAADCLGVAHRQGAASVTQLDMYPTPPNERDAALHPWPTWPSLLRVYPAHEEGGERHFAVAVTEFVGGDDGRVSGVRLAEVSAEKREGRRIVTPKPGSERLLRADLVLLAIGFAGTDAWAIARDLGLTSTVSGGIDTNGGARSGARGVFIAGDMRLGASLVVTAIAEGRAAATEIDAYLERLA
jgi:glutamate synthase (NADPH) small chain